MRLTRLWTEVFFLEEVKETLPRLPFVNMPTERITCLLLINTLIESRLSSMIMLSCLPLRSGRGSWDAFPSYLLVPPWLICSRVVAKLNAMASVRLLRRSSPSARSSVLAPARLTLKDNLQVMLLLIRTDAGLLLILSLSGTGVPLLHSSPILEIGAVDRARLLPRWTLCGTVKELY